MDRTLRNRLTFGSLMLAALGGLFWVDWYIERATRDWAVGRGLTADTGVGGIGILVLLLAVCPLAVHEIAVLFTAERVRPYRFIAAAGASAMIGHAFLTQFLWFKPVAASALAFIVVLVMLFAALRLALARQTQDAIVRMAGTVLATLYLGGLAWFLIAIRVKQSELFSGTTSKLVLILLCVKFTDIGAYFGGRALGRHKLIPWLSPGKTWEGLACGLLAAAAVGTVCAGFIAPRAGHAFGLVWWKGAVFGLVIGGIGQLGDLLESMMKRDAEVKDSGSLIPGFGGVLDVIDSPLLAAPFAYLLFSVF